MTAPTPRWTRALALLAVPATVAASVSLAALPARADTAPAAGTPATASSDSLPAPQVDGVVWAQTVVGNTVYAGGSFTQAQPAGAAAGVGGVVRSDLLAYDLTTGALVPGFAPVLDGQVRGLAASPDGSTVYAVGDFTTVGGTKHNRVVALDAATGAVRPGFTASANGSVIAVAVSGSTVFLGGSFTAVDGVARTRAAAVSASTGAVSDFAPVLPDESVHALVVSPDGTKVVLGGSFTSMNGSTSPGRGLGAVDSATGLQNQTWNIGKLIYNHGPKSSIWSLTSDGTNVYGTGYVFGSVTDGNLEGAFNATWADGTLNWIEDCHGDTYGSAVLGDAVYTVSHDHYCGNVPNGFAQSDPSSSKATKQRALAFSRSVAGVLGKDPYGNPYYNFAGTPAPKLLSWYPDLTAGSVTGQSQAAWTITAAGGYLLLGGEFPTVNGKRQAGLARFASGALAPNRDGPRLADTKWALRALPLASGSVRLSWPANWDRDNGNLAYTLRRGTEIVFTTAAESEGFWLRPALGYLDTGLAPGSDATYTITATDAFGNTATSAPVTVTVAGGTGANAYPNAVLGDGASDLWRFGEAAGPTVADSAGFGDLTAGTGVTFRTPGALQGDADTGATFSGDTTGTGLAATQSAIPGPNTFSIETWFRTTSTAGGKIVGFGSAKTGLSSSYDRHVYLDGTGAVSFGVYNGTSATLRSSAGYNDGRWHAVVATLSTAGMQLFLDGKRVAARTDVTAGQAYNGYWRIGGDRSWSGASWFTGSIDDTAIYPTALSLAKVRAHYAAAGYGGAIAAPTDVYGKQIAARAPDTWWRLGDPARSATIADASGNGVTGAVSGGVTFGTAGAIAGTTDTAATFGGTNGLVVASQAQSAPSAYSLQLWFRTTTRAGGKLIGFGDRSTGESVTYDRHVWMLDSGQLAFGVLSGGQRTVLTSARAYNDGVRHQVVATQGADGIALYVDGVAVATNAAATKAQAYQGWWRIGGDHTWGGSTSDFFAGTLDEVAIHGSVLTPGQIADDYRLGASGTADVPPAAAFSTSSADLDVAVDASGSRDPDGTIASYAWNFGDGTPVRTGASATASHTYVAGGPFTVSLTVTDDRGATSTVAKQVTVLAANRLPTAAFSSDVTGLGASLDGTGSTDSDGTIASHAWDFGDGSAVWTGTSATASHTWATAGSYRVTLTVTDDRGGSASVTHDVAVVQPNVPPTASFTASAAGLVVAVDASASSDPDGTVASYAWRFGDGATATGRTTSHAYAAAGAYTVQLTVTDDAGASTATTRSVTITAPTWTPVATDAFGRTVSGGLGTADLGGAWTLAGTAADFSVASDAARFATAAGQTRSAYLGDVAAASSDVSTTITVPALPVGGTAFAGVVGRRAGTSDYGTRVLVSPTGAVSIDVGVKGVPLRTATVPGLVAAPGVPLRVRLQTIGASPTTLQARVWRASDAEPSGWQVTATDSTAVLQVPGSVGLRGYLGSGVTGGTTPFAFGSFTALAIGVPAAPAGNAAPKAAFAATPTDLQVSVDGGASSDADGTIASYAWTFGDGGTATGATASHTYAAAGAYAVTLSVTDDRGATASISKQVVVTAPVTRLAADAFGRTVAPGLGSADAGGAWTTSGTAAWYSVDGGSAVLATPAGQTLSARLDGVSATSSDIAVSATIVALPVGGSVHAGVIGRRVGTDDYSARAIVSATGAVTIEVRHGATVLKSAAVSGTTVTAGSALRIRLRTTGTGTTTLSARAWLKGTAEPTAWQVTATDTTAAMQAAGAVGIRSYLGASVTNGPAAIRFDDFAADSAD